MTDHDHRPRPVVEQVLQLRQRLDVQIVRRLVEEQHVRLGHEQPRQLQPPPLPARQVPHQRALATADEAQPLRQLPGRHLLLAQLDALGDLLDRLQDPPRAVQVLHVLRQPRQLHRAAHLDAPRGRLPVLGRVGQRPQQRGLARAVDTEQPDALPGPQQPVQMLQQHLVPGLDGDVARLEDGLAQPRGGEGDQLGRVARRRLVRDELVGRVDAELRLRRARLGAAPQPGQLLAHEVLALLLGERRLALALGPRQDIGGVAAVVLVDGAALDVPDPVADLVEEPPVVGDDDDRGLQGVQVRGQPGDALDVEVVGRLVEQEEVGALGEARGPSIGAAGQDPGEVDAPALAAGEDPDPRIEPLGQERRVEAAEQAAEDFADLRRGGPLVGVGVAEQGGADARLVRERVALPEVGDGGAAGVDDAARVGLVGARDELQQRRLPVAVAADHADALPGGDAERDRVEDDLLGVGLGDVLEVHKIGRC